MNLHASKEVAMLNSCIYRRIFDCLECLIPHTLPDPIAGVPPQSLISLQLFGGVQPMYYYSFHEFKTMNVAISYIYVACVSYPESKLWISVKTLPLVTLLL